MKRQHFLALGGHRITILVQLLGNCIEGANYTNKSIQIFELLYTWGWVGLGGTMAHHCITACSEECSLASNLRAQQQSIAIQQSDSSEYSLEAHCLLKIQ